MGMRTYGKNVTPVHVPEGESQYVKLTIPAPGGDTFSLVSNEVYPDSIVVFTDNNGSPGEYLTPGTDYIFRDNYGASGEDQIELTNINDATVIHVAYSYMNPNAKIFESIPILIEPKQCNTVQMALFQGRGQGFASVIEDSAISGSTSIPFDFSVNDDGNTATDIQSIIITNPPSNAAPFGSEPFQLQFNFEDDLPKKAVLESSQPPIFTIKITKPIQRK